MTGRDLIVYILENKLEDKPVFGNNSIIGTTILNVKQACIRLGVGPATVHTLYGLKKLRGIVSGSSLYIFEESIYEYMKENGGSNG